MKAFLKIIDSDWYGSKNKKMIYTADNGTRYVGKPMEVSTGETIIAEITSSEMEDGYYHIIKVVGNIPKK